MAHGVLSNAERQKDLVVQIKPKPVGFPFVILDVEEIRISLYGTGDHLSASAAFAPSARADIWFLA